MINYINVKHRVDEWKIILYKTYPLKITYKKVSRKQNLENPEGNFEGKLAKCKNYLGSTYN